MLKPKKLLQKYIGSFIKNWKNFQIAGESLYQETENKQSPYIT